MGAVMVIIILIATMSSLLLVTHTAPLSFNYTNFDQCTDDMKLAGDATCVKSGVQVTGFQYYTAGQAQYSKPMRLWDAATGNLTNFTSTFTFTMDNDEGDWTCDGMAFFIASFNRTWPGTSANTGLLGLMHGNHTYNATDNPFVAVEFDTYNNPDWDVWSNLSHVGVDINSIQSVASKRWKSYSDGTTTMWAQVSYNAGNLCASFTGLTENLTELPRDSLCYEVDLRDYLAEWAVIGFSGSTAWRYQSHTLKSWSFVSDLDAEGGPGIGIAGGGGKNNKTSSRSRLIMGLSVGIPVFILIAIFALVIKHFCYGKKEALPVDPPQESEKRHTIIPGAGSIQFEDLKHATGDFSDCLGEGGFGKVYKGKLRDKEVAVKIMQQHAEGSMKGYMSELATIMQLKHRNLVHLEGWSYPEERGELYLIYEYMQQSSLDRHLYDKDKPLDFGTRDKIAKDLGRGLHYLHHGCTDCVLHRDIKPNNVLLDSSFNAKLGDFGLAQVMDHDAAPLSYTGGTQGYVAPECAHWGTTKESDVYSFGVVLLQIFTGRKAFIQMEPVNGNDNQQSNLQHIVDWIWDLYVKDNNILEAADHKLNGKFDKERMRGMLLLGLQCAHPDIKLRPSMVSVTKVLNYKTKLKEPPLKYPYRPDYATLSPPRKSTPHPHVSSPSPLLVGNQNSAAQPATVITVSQSAPRDGGT